MALDHYVSQVHLRNFYSPTLQNKQMYGYRKRDGHIFPCSSKDVCRVEEGSTNSYLLRDREIEEFLKTIEPNYNQALNDLKLGRPNNNSIYVISGFLAFITSCSPTAMRLGTSLYRSIIEDSMKTLDKRGLISSPPIEFGNKSISALLEDSSIAISVDPKYPQAMGISRVKERAGIWGNSRWDLIHNNDPASPFFTNDFASAILSSDDDFCIVDRLIPLSSDFAVRIRPEIEAKKYNHDLSFPNFRCRTLRADRNGIRRINKAIVQSAEDLVFFKQKFAWTEPFLRKNRSYWIEPYHNHIPTENGFKVASTFRIAARA